MLLPLFSSLSNTRPVCLSSGTRRLAPHTSSLASCFLAACLARCLCPPALACSQIAARTKVLDYFKEQRELIADDHLIFNWTRSQEVGNETKLIQQLCWDMGFPVTSTPELYLSGTGCAFPSFFVALGQIRVGRDAK